MAAEPLALGFNILTLGGMARRSGSKQPKKSRFSGLFVCLVVWLNETNQMNQITR